MLQERVLLRPTEMMREFERQIRLEDSHLGDRERREEESLLFDSTCYHFNPRRLRLGEKRK